MKTNFNFETNPINNGIQIKFQNIGIHDKIGRCRVCIKILRTKKNKVKNAMVAMDRFESFKNIINITIKIDDRQHNKFVVIKIWSKPTNPNTKKIKILYLRENKLFKTKLPTKNNNF